MTPINTSHHLVDSVKYELRWWICYAVRHVLQFSIIDNLICAFPAIIMWCFKFKSNSIHPIINAGKADKKVDEVFRKSYKKCSRYNEWIIGLSSIQKNKLQLWASFFSSAYVQRYLWKLELDSDIVHVI